MVRACSAYIDALYEMYSTGQYAGQKWEAGALRYAQAMEALADRYSSDADAPALAAEAFANLTPWDFWRAGEAGRKGEGVKGAWAHACMRSVYGSSVCMHTCTGCA
jgi:hypothetical protein